jgi:Kef-type K+ transport system membrane component KefB
VLATHPPERLSALAVAAATTILGIIAWRIAVAPALLLGDDPAFECAVDERIRIGRARSTAVLACAAPAVLVSFAVLTLPASYRLYQEIAPIVLAAAFVVTMLFDAVALRQRMRVA